MEEIKVEQPNFNAKIKCINDRGLTPFFTVGEIYLAMPVTEKTFLAINNYAEIFFVNSDCFEVV